MSDTVMYVLTGVILVLCVVGFVVDLKVSGYYKVAKIYGRVYSFFAVEGVMATGYILYCLFTGMFFNKAFLSPKGLLFIGICIAICVVTVLMYVRVYKKSPDFLKKRCLIDLTLSGFGTSLRVSLFIFRLFISTWWQVSKPETYRLDNGMEVYVFPDGMVYDANQGRFGKYAEGKDGNNPSVIWDH